MELIKLGKIVNTRGLKGEVKILSTTSFGKERYKKGNKIRICSQFLDGFLTVVSYNKSGQFDYVKFEEITSIDEAVKLKEAELFISSDELNNLKDDYFYHYQLLNMNVYNESDKLYGKVIGIENYGANDILRIQTEVNQVLVPFIKQFIIEIDVFDKKIKLKGLEEFK